MGSDPEHYVVTKSRNNITAHLWTFPKAKPDDLKAKIGQDLRKKLDEKNSTPASPIDDVSNWLCMWKHVHVEACTCGSMYMWKHVKR